MFPSLSFPPGLHFWVLSLPRLYLRELLSFSFIFALIFLAHIQYVCAVVVHIPEVTLKRMDE